MRQQLSQFEKQQLKIALTEKIQDFMSEQTDQDNNIGYVPDDIEDMMATAAMAVLEAVSALNTYFEKEGMLTE